MNSATVFDLKTCPQFHLRPDFAAEIGFVDFLRDPIPPEAFAARAQQKHARGEVELLTYDEYCAVKANTPISRWYALCAPVSMGEKNPTAVISDRVHNMAVDYDGLFRDMTIRVNHSLGLGPDAPCPIVVPAQAEPATMHIYPTFFVYHDSEISRAYVVPYEQLRNLDWTLAPRR